MISLWKGVSENMNLFIGTKTRRKERKEGQEKGRTFKEKGTWKGREGGKTISMINDA